MFKTNNDLYREAIGKTVAKHAGESPDSSAIAEAAVITWLEMCAQLKPVLGVRGVNALFRRSLHLTKISFPEIGISDFNENDTNLLTGLKNNLTRREKTNAFESICDLLVTFTELLATVIGESLTKRLLAKTWVIPPPTNKDLKYAAATTAQRSGNSKSPMAASISADVYSSSKGISSDNRPGR